MQFCQHHDKNYVIFLLRLSRVDYKIYYELNYIGKDFHKFELKIGTNYK
jgi:hypothetical protein